MVYIHYSNSYYYRNYITYKNAFFKKKYDVLNEYLEASQLKWLNFNYILYGVNSFRLGVLYEEMNRNLHGIRNILYKNLKYYDSEFLFNILLIFDILMSKIQSCDLFFQFYLWRKYKHHNLVD